MLGSKINRFILINLTMLIIVSAIWTIIAGAYDFSYTITLIHQLIYLEIGVLLIGLYKYKQTHVFEIIIWVFFAQSIIQILSFISPTFLRYSDLFRASGVIAQRRMSYTGFRGLAIAGSNFFGLAVAYSIVFIVMAFYWNEWNISIPKKIIVSTCMIFGALSAGRTSFVGIAIFVIIIVGQSLKGIRNTRRLKEILFTIVGVILAIIVFRSQLLSVLTESSAWNSFNRYIFQVFGETGNYRSFSINNSNSLSQLVNDYYFKLSFSQFMIGDGKFTDSNGSYYMNTDAGYMRNVLYWGVFMSAILYLFQFRFIFCGADNKRQKTLAWVLFLSLAIFEYKGQTMGFLIISQGLILLITYGMKDISSEYTHLQSS